MKNNYFEQLNEEEIININGGSFAYDVGAFLGYAYRVITSGGDPGKQFAAAALFLHQVSN